MKSFINRIAHRLYMLIGTIFCNCVLTICKIRDKFSKSKSDSILFVAHPDDDALFFNKYILQNKPYVVLLFTGWSIKRLKDFFKVMKHYDVRFRPYATISANAYDNYKRKNKTKKHIAFCLKTCNYKTVLTHNSTGEYGHPTHRLVHECVMNVCRDKSYEIICPVGVDEIGKYPLTEDEIEKKKYIFETMYKSEAWVMTDDAAGTPIWFFNEKLEKIK